MKHDEHDLAVRLTKTVVVVPGVHGIFPQSVVAAAVAVVVGAERNPATGLVSVKRHPDRLEISARVAIDADTPATRVAADIGVAIRAELAEDAFVLGLEIAHLT